MSDHRVARRGARTAADVAQRRIASVVGTAAAAVGAVFALGGCAIAAALGSGPGLLGFVGIVAVTAAVCGLAARALVRRIDIAVIAGFVARRIVGRRRR